MAQLVAMPTLNSEVSETQFLSVETFEVSLVVARFSWNFDTKIQDCEDIRVGRETLLLTSYFQNSLLFVVVVLKFHGRPFC
jgi:hypothetical protein